MSKSERDQAVVERSVAENGNPSVFVRSDGFGSSVVIAMKKLGGVGDERGREEAIPGGMAEGELRWGKHWQGRPGGA